MLKYAENKDKYDKPLSTEEDGQCDSVTELFTVITVVVDFTTNNIKLNYMILLLHLSSVNFK